MRILLINGPNINMLGLREPEIYGDKTYDDLIEYVSSFALSQGIQLTVFQSNHEGELVDEIQRAFKTQDGIVINPAAYTHTSIAILDALKAVGLPAVEVHISDVSKREAYRQISYVSDYCEKRIQGLGFEGYIEAIKHLMAR
ncbi:MAG: type II 3-dehydroquinate dehydratase [Tissierellia bacterium]|nr:type II 3-dehydroquinate dehydratase [Tissierellia bacterium]